MQKYEILKRLEELKDYEKIEFTMYGDIRRCAYRNDIKNFEDAEMLEAPNSDFQAPYVAVEAINPVE